MYSAPKTDTVFLPVNLRIGGRPVLVIGAGKAAFPEVTRLIEFGAMVTVIAPRVMTEIEDLARAYSGRLSLLRRKYGEEDTARVLSRHYALVFALSGDSKENQKAQADAAEAGVLAASVEPGFDSDLMLPTTLKRGHLKISVSTDGVSHALEKAMLERIEGSLTADIDSYVIFLSQLRETLTWLLNDARLSAETVKQVGKDLAVSEELYRAISRKNFEEARKLVEHIISQHGSEASETTTV